MHASSGVALLQLLDMPDTARRALFLAHTLASTGALSRAALHARFLGMSEIAFSQLGEEFSVESEAEHECFWQAEAD